MPVLLHAMSEEVTDLCLDRTVDLRHCYRCSLGIHYTSSLHGCRDCGLRDMEHNQEYCT